MTLLVEKISYSILHQPDLAGITVFSVIFLISLAFYRFSKEKVNYKTVAKLVGVSIVFVFVWFIFTVIVRAIYSLIVLTSWFIILVISLRVLLKKEISK